jgi:type IV pilus assembly protein PilF
VTVNIKIIAIALSILLSACATNPKENITAAQYNVQLGLGYLAQDDKMRAKEKLLRAKSQAPHLIDTHLALAYYYQTVGQMHLADEAYQSAWELDPKAGNVNNNYALFLCSQNQYDQAMSHFETAFQAVDYLKLANAYENAALCAAKAGDVSKAHQYANLALQQNSTSRVHEKLTILLAQQ